MNFSAIPNFAHSELWNGNLYIAGDCNIDTDTLGKLFSDLNIPECKGNFAIVWQGTDGWCFAQTDHLNTYPLWYKEDGSAIYSLWSPVTDIQKDDVSLCNA